MHHHEQTISAKYGQEIFCMKESYLLGEGFGGNILYGRIIPFGEGFGLGLVRKKKKRLLLQWVAHRNTFFFLGKCSKE
jgi:hypothetical protein